MNSASTQVWINKQQKQRQSFNPYRLRIESLSRRAKLPGLFVYYYCYYHYYYHHYHYSNGEVGREGEESSAPGSLWIALFLFRTGNRNFDQPLNGFTAVSHGAGRGNVTSLSLKLEWSTLRGNYRPPELAVDTEAKI